MRSIVTTLILLYPLLGLAGEEANTPVMTATCQCEVTTADGIIVDPRSDMGMMPTPMALDPFFFAFGEYTLDMKGNTYSTYSTLADKHCGYKTDGSNDFNWSCTNAMWFAEQRAIGDCAVKAKQYGQKATGLLVPGSCTFELEGAEKPATISSL